MRKIIFIYMLSSFLLSAPVDINEASEVARHFYNSRSMSVEIDSIIEVSEDSKTFMYVYKLSPVGFVIVSADDLVMPILGYSFENNFNYDQMPIQVGYLLDIYKQNINEQISMNATASDFIIEQWELHSNPHIHQRSRNVSPLLTCRWNQDSPWNDMCPADQDGPGANVYAGCVAISMAQVMYYWRYPEVGFGSHGYNPGGGYGYQYADYGNTTYDYDSMEDNFATEASQLLIYHAGVAVNMGYSPNGSGAWVLSGANSTYNAMKNYFIYDHSIDAIESSDYSTSQYRSILQSDLDNNQPIIYRGCSTDGCHAWNIDGYDDDYFHNNFGWGGSNNGYYLLSALNGFNWDQGALVSIVPEELDDPNIMLTNTEYYESFGDSDDIINPGETVNYYITIENYIPWSDASSVSIVLESLSDDVIVVNESIYVGNLNAGDEYQNISPFQLDISEDAYLGSHPMRVYIISNNGEYIFDFDVDIEVSLFQAGFPYDTFDQVKTNPLIIDIDNDLDNEIIFSDNMGFVHVVNHDGSSYSDNFPFEIGSDVWGAIAAEDIDLDGDVEFVVTSKSKYIYIFSQYGLENTYFADSYLLGTPAIGQLDADAYFEIVVGGFNSGASSTNKLYVINHDGTDVNGFPMLVGEKIKSGVGLFDFDENGYDDIVFGTESDNLYLVMDSGLTSAGFPLDLGDKIQVEPSILISENDKKIFVGSKEGVFYSISDTGDIVFSIETGGDICTSASFLNGSSGLMIFFASEDGYIYSVGANGQTHSGWPVDVNGDAVGSITFGDIDGDGSSEIIASVNSQIMIFNQDGSSFIYDSIIHELPLSSAPSIVDLNQDGNIEVIVGTGTDLSSVDFKFDSSEILAWTMHRGDARRTGAFVAGDLSQLGDVNMDSQLDILDIVIIVNFAMGESIPSSGEFVASDLNFDGQIDILDVVLIVNLILN